MRALLCPATLAEPVGRAGCRSLVAKAGALGATAAGNGHCPVRLDPHQDVEEGGCDQNQQEKDHWVSVCLALSMCI